MVTQITSPLDRTGRLTINARLPRTVRGRHSPLHPREGTRHAKPARHLPDSAVELDPPDRLGLDLCRPALDRRLAVTGVPSGRVGIVLLVRARQVPAALSPVDG